MPVCKSCERVLPARDFPVRSDGWMYPDCHLCKRDHYYAKRKLAPIPRDGDMVRLNNVASLWFGPASNDEPLRWAI